MHNDIIVNPHAPDDHWVSPSGSDTWCKIGQLKQLLDVEATDEMIDAACAAVPDLFRVDAMRIIEAALSARLQSV